MKIFYYFLLFFSSQFIIHSSDFLDIQLQGEITGDPVYLSGFGVFVSTDDRKAHLIDVENGDVRTWALPRIPKGQPSISKHGLMGIPLSDGKLALVNPRGGLIRVQAPPSDGRGIWRVDDEGRIYWGLNTKLWALSPSGKEIRVINLKNKIDGLSKDGFFTRRDGKSFLIDLEDNSLELIEELKSDSIVFSSSQYGYELSLNLADQAFSYKVQAALIGKLIDLESGIIAWGDERWKVFIKKITPFAVNKIVKIKKNSLDDLEKEFRKIALYANGDSKLLLEFFDNLLNYPDYYPWVEGKILSIILMDGTNHYFIIDDPKTLLILKEFFGRLASLSANDFLANRLFSLPDEYYRILPFMSEIGIDSQGFCLQAIDKLLSRRKLDQKSKQEVKDLVLQFIPSLPSEYSALVFDIFTKINYE